MSETLLMNDEAARTTTGEILDQSTTQPTTQPNTADASTTTTSTDPKSTEPASTTEPAKPEVKPADAKAPDTYVDFKAPDGYELDKSVLEAATPVFKELGLTQDQAQKLVDIQIQRDLAQAKARDDTYSTLRNEWQGKVKSDPELAKAATDGKTGLDAVKIDIGRALAVLPPTLATEFKDAMNLTGAGDHPAFVKAMWKLSQHITEGRPVKGANPSPEGQRAPGTGDKPSPARALYPNNP